MLILLIFKKIIIHFQIFPLSQVHICLLALDIKAWDELWQSYQNGILGCINYVFSLQSIAVRSHAVRSHALID